MNRQAPVACLFACTCTRLGEGYVALLTALCTQLGGGGALCVPDGCVYSAGGGASLKFRYIS